MWTSTMDLDLKKVLLTQLIGRFYHNIYFSSYSPLQVQNLPRQSLPENSWVRVRNRLAGIGGNDLRLLYGDSDVRVATAAAPGQKHFYPGHEVVGEVIEIGDDVQHLQVGDRVVLHSGPNCLTAGVEPLCHACASGSYNLCEQGVYLAAQPLGGGWSEEMLLHEQQLYHVPDSLSDEQAVMLEPTAVALHAVLRHLPMPGERVLIIGAGTIGLLTQQILSALAPQTEVSVMARYPFQIEQATRQGARHIIYPHDAYVGIQRATQARLYHGFLGNQILIGGYDAIYDTVGRRQTLHHALRWTHTQGTVVLVGQNPHLMHIDLTPLWQQEISLLGSTAHGIEYWPLNSEQQCSTMSVAAELMEQGHINPEQLITHNFALNNYQHALLTASKKSASRAIKVVFDYSLLPASVVPNVRASAPRIRRPTTIEFHERTGEPALTNTGQQAGGVSPAFPERQYLSPGRPLSRNKTRNIPVDENGGDDDTATALPVVGKQGTREFPPYAAQSQLQGSGIPRPPTRTREIAPKKTPSIPMEEEQEVENEQATVRVSKDEIKRHIPQTDANLSSTPDIADINVITPAPQQEDQEEAAIVEPIVEEEHTSEEHPDDAETTVVEPEAVIEAITSSEEQATSKDALAYDSTLSVDTELMQEQEKDLTPANMDSSMEPSDEVAYFFQEAPDEAAYFLQEAPDEENLDQSVDEAPIVRRSEPDTRGQSSQSRNRNRKKRSGGR